MNPVLASAEDEAEADGLKRQLLTRAAVAAGLIVLLLGGLAVYDRLHRAPSVPAAPPGAGGAVEPAAVPASPALAVPAENSLADVVLKRDTPPEPELSAAPVLAAPGQRQADAPEAPRGGPRLVLGGEPDLPPAAAPSPSVPSPARAGLHEDASSPAGKPAAAGGYLVQMGVFGAPENAEALRSHLLALGIPARLESRVVAGPFPDKAAARAAQIRLREAGEAPGLIRPARH
jgi:DedD protein